MSRITPLGVVLAPVLLVDAGCVNVDHTSPREYADVVSMERHFRPNENAYRALASGWLSGGRTSMCWFGTSLLGRETYQWGEFWVSPEWWSWDVMHWNGHEYVNETASSFDQTALISGTTSKEVVRWHEQMASLGVDCISTTAVTFAGETFRYVQLEYFPPRHPNGLLYAPPSSNGTARQALSLWAQKASSPSLQMRSFGDGWFYYDGHLSRSDIPFAIPR